MFFKTFIHRVLLTTELEMWATLNDCNRSLTYLKKL